MKACRHSVNRWLWVLSFLAWCAPLQAEPEGSERDAVLSLLRAHCFRCHGEDKVKGGVHLVDEVAKGWPISDPDFLEEILDEIRSGNMPPEKADPLGKSERLLILKELQGHLDQALTEGKGHWPRTPIRRLNRFQYANAVRDLFDLKVEVFALPERIVRDYGYFEPGSGQMPETLKAGCRPLGKSQLIGKRLSGVAPFPQDLRAEHGFDNRADHLSLSPWLMESFLTLAQSIPNSVDFSRKTVGIWDEFFQAPADGGKELSMRSEIENRLRRFLSRAFRREPDEALLGRYVDHVFQGLEKDREFTEVMKSVASAVLVSPHFLYQGESESEGQGPQPVDGYELASRMALFLWGSIPDFELLKVARQGGLSDEGQLLKQVDRMIQDPRIKGFCDAFPSQWLQLDRIVASVPDPQRFPKFYFGPYRMSMHMVMEPLLLFETVLVENRALRELIHSDFTYRTDSLDEWYRTGSWTSRPPPTVLTFHRVPVDSLREGGVLSTAAVMTMTSSPTRTKPITRGAWVATVMLNQPPDPPPANVPALPEAVDNTSNATTPMPRSLRERLEAHRSQPDCMGCHRDIDPLGFALENYGPTGLWREQDENGVPIDARGELFHQTAFEDATGLKRALLKEEDRFAEAFVRHLLSYALGRELSASDGPGVRAILERGRQSDYRMRDLLKEVVRSRPFRQKYNPARELRSTDRADGAE